MNGKTASDIRIHDIGNYMLRNYLLETRRGWIALDTGYAGGFSAYQRRLKQLTPPENITHVFLTHAHGDHAGFLGELLQASGARLVASGQSVSRLQSGKNVLPEGTGFTSGFGLALNALMSRASFPPIVPDERAVLLQSAADQPFLSAGLPIRVVPLPGHTADSIGLFLEETRELLCGDAAGNAIIAPERLALLIEDVSAFAQSWDAILALNPRKIYPSHGNPFLPEDLVRFRSNLEHLRLFYPKSR